MIILMKILTKIVITIFLVWHINLACDESGLPFNSDYDEEYPELEDSEDDEDADFYNLVASRAGNFR